MLDKKIFEYLDYTYQVSVKDGFIDLFFIDNNRRAHSIDILDDFKLGFGMCETKAKIFFANWVKTKELDGDIDEFWEYSVYARKIRQTLKNLPTYLTFTT